MVRVQSVVKVSTPAGTLKALIITASLRALSVSTMVAALTLAITVTAACTPMIVRNQASV
jgi:hypothetical protein